MRNKVPPVLYQRLRAAHCLLSFILLLVYGCSFQQKAGPPDTLKVNYQERPAGLNHLQPRFSWILNDDRRGAGQTAYHIIVSRSRDDVEAGVGREWDTGKTISGETLNIRYGGESLESNTSYYWRVRIWDHNGDPSPWSEVHSFHVGLTEPSEWQAAWITPADTTVVSPLLRDGFELDGEIESAHAYVTGMGYYELYLNGEKVGDHVLDPAITDYDKSILYETYDVTDYLRQGDNAIGLWLGNGGYRISREQNRWTWYGTSNHFGTPGGLVQLHLRYRDGSTEIVGTDASWKSHPSPITYNNVYGGEDYDARREQDGWNEPGFDDTEWNPVETGEAPAGKLKPQLMAPVRVIETLQPRNRIQPAPGRYLYDLEQNIPGWWRIQVDGEAGTEIKVRAAETLNDSLHPTPLQPGDSLSTIHPFHSDVWTTYTLKGEGTETWEPRFFYSGFRYLEVTVSEPDNIDAFGIEGRVVHTDLERNGTFASSDTLLNAIYDAAIWSQRGNWHGYPTDCPHREKGGYNGDGQVIAEVSMHDFHMHPLFSKWLDDMRDSQYDNGRIPNTSPEILGGTGGGIAWGSAYILIPWWMYSYYDDKALLEDHYDSMKRYMQYLHTLARSDSNAAEPYIINEFGGHWDSIGEWEAPVLDRNGPVNPLTHTYYWYLDSITFAKIAGALDRQEDRSRYLALADTIKEAFNEKFFDPQTNLYGIDRPYQTYLLFALSGNLVPDGHRQAVLENLVRDITIAQEGHLGTGILGTKHLFDVMMDEGKQELLHAVVTKDTFPSWGHWIRNGATTLWEAWDATGSHNHQMFGSVSEYFYNYLAGIRPPTDPGSKTEKGYRHIHIMPRVPGQMTHAEGTLETVRGTVSSSWKKEGEEFNLNVTIPANTTATISVPKLEIDNVRVAESGSVVWDDGSTQSLPRGISFAANQNDYISFDVASGNYQFTVSSGN
ncbi:MAG: family 78 glycoside hydrolase catalytic domain [Balneolaceae bacterium]|nr:family 78 glycoside hydrolase catalytic domain [Balneolaceae bacterium]